MSDATPPRDVAPPRPGAINGAIGAIVGAGLGIGGMLITVGGWRGEVDQRDVEFERRLTVVEQTQRTNLPIFAGMQKDISYLAERARRDDERREREHGASR